MGKQLGMRHVPALTFVADQVPEEARAMEELLARAKAHDDELAAHRGTTYAGDEDPYKKPREVADDEDDLDDLDDER